MLDFSVGDARAKQALDGLRLVHDLDSAQPVELERTRYSRHCAANDAIVSGHKVMEFGRRPALDILDALDGLTEVVERDGTLCLAVSASRTEIEGIISFRWVAVGVEVLERD